MSAGAPNPFQWEPARPVAPTRADPPPRRDAAGWWAAAIAAAVALVLAAVWPT